jgi:hypothetical protein
LCSELQLLALSPVGSPCLHPLLLKVARQAVQQ